MIYFTLLLLKPYFRRVLTPLATSLLRAPIICDFCLSKMWTPRKRNTLSDLVE